jgi:hypothetical protein
MATVPAFFADLRQQVAGRRLAFWEIVAGFAFFLGLAVIPLIAVGFAADGRTQVRLAAALALTAFAAWIAGSIIGFLFGVPRFKSETAPTSAAQQTVIQYAPNTNLEQVSDWLTKVIIGATLVQIQVIPGRLQSMCDWIAGDLGDPHLAPIVGGLIIFFGFTGFLWCYLWSSIRIMQALARQADDADAPAAAGAPVAA